MTARRAATRHALAASQLPAYTADLAPVRGRCIATLGRSKRVCGSRYGITRVSLDLTSRDAVDRLATVECVECHAVWRRVRPPAKVTSAGSYQSVLLDIIVPSEQRRWFARNRWHVRGEDAVVLRNANIGELMAAMEDWRRRNGQLLAVRAKAAARKEAKTAEARAATQALFARLAEMDAARAAEEAAAAAREA